MIDNVRITYLKNIRTLTSESKTLKDIFLEIKSDLHKEITLELNNLYKIGSELYSIKKKNLPAVTFSGLFESNNRKKSGIINYNNILVIDIDKLDENKLLSIKMKLSSEKFLYASWFSPSRAGIKGIIKLKYNDVLIDKNNIDTHHKRAFKKISNYFFDKYNIEIDGSGNDYTRLCFISHDKDLFINKDFKEFEINNDDYVEIIKSKNKNHETVLKEIENKKFILNNCIGKNKQSNKKEILKIIKYLKINNLSITNSYNNWLRVAFAISNSFNYDLGKLYFIELSKMDSQKFNESECLNLLEDCYYNSKGEININTIIHLAKEKNYKSTN